MRVLILCAGSGERWGNHLGVPKHFAPILGQTLLERHVDQAMHLAPDPDVHLVVNPQDPQLDLYAEFAKYNDVLLAPAKLDPEYRDADKFLSSHHLWSGDERTVMLYGDTWLSTAAAEKIYSDRPSEDGWAVYARFGGSTVTGTKWAENFAHVIDPEARGPWLDSLLDLPSLTDNWFQGRCGGHEQYMNMEFGDPCQYPRLGPHGVHIDDWSDDFDYPADWDRWCYRWATAAPATKALAV